jgi:hypothetical protein
MNYLPDATAHWIARRFGRAKGEQTWPEMLRGGIRGGTERTIITALTGGHPEDGEILQSTEDGLRDRADYWLCERVSKVSPGESADRDGVSHRRPTARNGSSPQR